MNTLLLVALGGALGASGRFLAGTAIRTFFPGAFPWGTLFVNVTGCLVLGLVAGVATQTWNPGAGLRAFLTVGVLGGFTTFSAFSLDAVQLAERGRWDLALAYMGLTFALCILGLFGGLQLSRMVTS